MWISISGMGENTCIYMKSRARQKASIWPSMSSVSEKIPELKMLLHWDPLSYPQINSVMQSITQSTDNQVRMLISLPYFWLLSQLYAFYPLQSIFLHFFKCYCKKKLVSFFFPVYKTPDRFFWDISSCKLSDSSNAGPCKKLRECPSTKNTNIEYRWQWLAITCCGIASCLGIRLD